MDTQNLHSKIFILLLLKGFIFPANFLERKLLNL